MNFIKDWWEFIKDCWQDSKLLGFCISLCFILLIGCGIFLTLLLLSAIDGCAGKTVFHGETVVLSREYVPESSGVILVSSGNGMTQQYPVTYPEKWKLIVNHKGEKLSGEVSNEFFNSHDVGSKVKVSERVGLVGGLKYLILEEAK